MKLLRFFSKRTTKTSSNITRRVFGTPGYDEQQPGLPDLEFMDELSPPDGLDKFRVMERNEPIIGGLILSIKNVIKRVSIDVDGDNIDFVLSQLEGLDGGIVGVVEDISSAFTYGFYLGERVWAVEDGKVILKDVIPLHQPTINAINNSDGMVIQQASDGTHEIPYKKCVHHIFLKEGRSPYGVSLLRHLYKPYYYKVSCEAAEATGADRDLTGLPLLQAPEGFDFTAADESSPHYDPAVAATLDWAVDVVSNVRKDNQQGLVIPAGWQFSLVRSDGTSSINTSEIIQRYNSEMAAGLLESFLAAGASSLTSKGNIEAMIRVFLSACDAYIRSIEETINNQIIAKICEYNNIAPPRVRFSSTNVADLADVASFVARLVKTGVITPTIPMEKALLAIADLPYEDDESQVKDIEPFLQAGGYGADSEA